MRQDIELIVDWADGTADANDAQKAKMLAEESPGLRDFQHWLDESLPLIKQGRAPRFTEKQMSELMDWFLGEWGFMAELDSQPQELTCVSDSAADTAPVGLRRSGSHDRRIQLKGGGYSLVMESQSGAGGEPGALVGQLLDNDRAGILMTLTPDGETSTTEFTDSNGHFYFGCVPSDVELTLLIEDPIDVARSATFRFES